MYKNLLNVFVLQLFLMIAVFEMNPINAYAQDILAVEKRALQTIGENDQELYFHRPQFVKYNSYDDHIYVVDTGNNRIVKLNTNLEFLEEIGRKGQGPAEFIRPTSIDFTSDKRFVIYDVGNTRVQILNHQYKYEKGFRLKVSSNPAIVGISVDNRIFGNIVSGSHNMAAFDIEGNELTAFGRLFKNHQESHIKFANGAFTVVDPSNNIYVVYQEQAILRKFDKNLSLIYEKDFSDLPPAKVSLKFWKERTAGKQGLSYIWKLIVRSVSIDEKYVYMLFPGDWTNNPIYAFDKNTGEPVKKIILRIPGEKVSNVKFQYFDFSSANNIYAIDLFGSTVSKFDK